MAAANRLGMQEGCRRCDGGVETKGGRRPVLPGRLAAGAARGGKASPGRAGSRQLRDFGALLDREVHPRYSPVHRCAKLPLVRGGWRLGPRPGAPPDRAITRPSPSNPPPLPLPPPRWSRPRRHGSRPSRRPCRPGPRRGPGSVTSGPRRVTIVCSSAHSKLMGAAGDGAGVRHCLPAAVEAGPPAPTRRVWRPERGQPDGQGVGASRRPSCPLMPVRVPDHRRPVLSRPTRWRGTATAYRHGMGPLRPRWPSAPRGRRRAVANGVNGRHARTCTFGQIRPDPAWATPGSRLRAPSYRTGPGHLPTDGVTTQAEETWEP
jgi:hypothetical protein